MAVLTHFLRNYARTEPSPTLLFHFWHFYKEHNTGHNSRGGRVGPGGDCEASGEAPSKSTVGSFTKRSGVERRARATDEFSFLYNQQVNRWHYFRNNQSVNRWHYFRNNRSVNRWHYFRNNQSVNRWHYFRNNQSVNRWHHLKTINTSTTGFNMFSQLKVRLNIHIIQNRKITVACHSRKTGNR